MGLASRDRRIPAGHSRERVAHLVVIADESKERPVEMEERYARLEHARALRLTSGSRVANGNLFIGSRSPVRDDCYCRSRSSLSRAIRS
jgi:hypothetical protein